VAGAFVIKSMSITDVTALAGVCSTTPRCNAFDTTGALLVVPMAPFFSNLDTGAADVAACDGVYVMRRTLTGLHLPVRVRCMHTHRPGAQFPLPGFHNVR
jgi:hypothetical protein